MYERFDARIEGMDLETGRFPATLVTEGEASDGHILSVKGGQLPERMPMLVSHYNEPTSQAGSVFDPVKHPKDAPPRIRVTGQIEMGGEGPAADVRRDLAYMISQGHVNAMSVRWDEVPGKPPIRRINLASDHPYFVDADKEKDYRKRWGYYFEHWTAKEGSIVSLGADPGALIGRAEETDGAVRSFWRAMARDAERGEVSDEVREMGQAELEQVFLRKRHFEDGECVWCREGICPKQLDEAGAIAAALSVLRVDAEQARQRGASLADCINAVALESEEDFEAVDFGEDDASTTVFLPRGLAERIEAEREEREAGTQAPIEPEPDPARASEVLARLDAISERLDTLAAEPEPTEPQISGPEAIRFLRHELAQARSRWLKETARPALERRRGKVQP